MSQSDIQADSVGGLGFSGTDGGSVYAPLRTLANRDPVVVPPSASLRDALFLISQGHADAVVVVDEYCGIALKHPEPSVECMRLASPCFGGPTQS